MKSYTDLEQSRKLAEILPLESADMCYTLEDFVDEDTGDIFSIEKVSLGHPSDKEIGCWSLAALLGVIPNYKLSSEHNYHTCTAETSFGKETVAWFDNPVDACVAMIKKLNELNLL